MPESANISVRVPYRHHEPEAYEEFIKQHFSFKIAGYGSTFGLLPENVALNFRWPLSWALDRRERSITLFEGRTEGERSTLFSDTFQSMAKQAETSHFVDPPKGEMLPVFGPDRELVLSIDRSASILFDTVSYGVQMLAYTRTEHGVRYWVPRRSRTKRSYPGMLDNCVGGALNTGETPLTCLVREASEEASLPEEYVRANAKSFGVVSYHMATNGNGEEGHQPQVMYVYHIELAPDVVPTPSDGEVERFELLALEEVQTTLKNGEFKTNCAMTWLEYFISFGILNTENEPDLHRISTHLHRSLDFPVK